MYNNAVRSAQYMGNIQKDHQINLDFTVGTYRRYVNQFKYETVTLIAIGSTIGGLTMFFKVFMVCSSVYLRRNIWWTEARSIAKEQREEGDFEEPDREKIEQIKRDLKKRVSFRNVYETVARAENLEVDLSETKVMVHDRLEEAENQIEELYKENISLKE